jgi:hypothetical protein
MTIDEEIKMLKERLAELEKEKAKAGVDVHLVDKKLKDAKIKVFGDDQTTWNDVVKTFDCFKDLYDFWSSKMNKTDYIYLEYYSKPDSKYIEHECYSYDDFVKIVNIIATLNAQQLTSMDFTICTKKGNFRYYSNIENEYLEFFYYALNHSNHDISEKYNIDEDEYWKRMDEGKNYKLEFTF